MSLLTPHKTPPWRIATFASNGEAQARRHSTNPRRAAAIFRSRPPPVSTTPGALTAVLLIATTDTDFARWLPACSPGLSRLGVLARGFRDSGSDPMHLDFLGISRAGVRPRVGAPGLALVAVPCFRRPGPGGEWKLGIKQLEADVVRPGAAAVRQHDDADRSRRFDSRECSVTAGPAIVPDDRAGAGVPDDPVESDACVRPCGRALLTRERQRLPEVAALGMQVRVEELEHVAGRRADRARAGERGNIPIGHDGPSRIMAPRQMLLHPRRQRDRRVCHPERLPHALAFELFVGLAR